MSLPAIILAAGASRRLGQPKQIVPVGEETLLDRTIRVAKEAGAHPIFVVLGASLSVIAARASLCDVHIVENANWEQGIATSIHAGVQALQALIPSTEGVLLLVCDQPRLTVAHLLGAMELFFYQKGPTIIASTYAEMKGIPAVFPVSQFPNLLALTGDTGARYLLRSPTCPIVSIPFPDGQIDIDTPSDLASIQSDRS